MNKRGSIGDLFYILLVIFITAIVFVAGWMIFSKVNTNMQADDGFGTEGKAIMQASADQYVGLTDGVFLTILIGMYLGAVILAFQIEAHPIFFFASIILFGVLVLLSAAIGNAYYAFATTAEIETYATDYTVIPFVMNNFVQMFVVMGFGLAGVMYAKAR